MGVGEGVGEGMEGVDGMGIVGTEGIGNRGTVSILDSKNQSRSGWNGEKASSLVREYVG